MTEEKLKKIRDLDKEVAALQREVKKKKTVSLSFERAGEALGML